MEQSSTTEEEVNRLVKKFIPLVFHIAHKLKVPPWHWEDCISEGMFVLFKCARNFDKSVKFITYVYPSIRGSMLNVLQERYNKFKLVHQLVESDKAYVLADIPIEHTIFDIPKIPINILNKREKVIIWMYYFEERTLEEIGKVIGLSREAIRQIKSRALIKLREEMT